MCACRIVMNCSALPVHSIVVETILLHNVIDVAYLHIYIYIGPPSASVSISSGDVHRHQPALHLPQFLIKLAIQPESSISFRHP